MKRLFTFLPALLLMQLLRSQCLIDTTIQDWGFHPDTGTVLKHACAGSSYDAVIQIFAPQSVTVSVGTFPVNYVRLDSMQGLPAGLSYATNPASGVIQGGERGCIDIYGLANAVPGTYRFTIFYTANFNVFGLPSDLVAKAPYTIQIDSGTATFSQFNDTVCRNAVYAFNNQLLNTAGSYNDTLSNQAGCDSIVTLRLAVTGIDTAVVMSNDTLFATPGYDNYIWFDCNTGQDIFTGANPVFVFGSHCCMAVVLQNKGCSDTSACFTYTVSGVKEAGSNTIFKLFPVLAGYYITVESSAIQNSTLSIYALDGRLINTRSVEPGKNVIDITAFNAGIYLAEVKANGDVKYFRFIKQ